MSIFQVISAIMGILIIAVIITCLCNTRSKNLLTISLLSSILFAAALFSTLYPTWWSIAITISSLTAFTIICLQYIKSEIKSTFGTKISFCYLMLYAVQLAICIIILSTNWCWYIALVYIPIAITLTVLGLLSAVSMIAVAVAIATKH